MSLFDRKSRPNIHGMFTGYRPLTPFQRFLRKLRPRVGTVVAFGVAGTFLAAVVFFAIEGVDNHSTLNRPWIQTSPNDAVMPAQPYMDEEAFYEDSDFWWGVGAGHILSGSGNGNRHYYHDRTSTPRTTGRYNTRSSTLRR